MTRVNCVDVKLLTREHLIAEYKEIQRISKLARPCTEAPSTYVLGKGHVKFFYDKGSWLKRRFEQELVPEMQRRGYTTNFTKYREHPEGLNNDWTPTQEDKDTNWERLLIRGNYDHLLGLGYPNIRRIHRTISPQLS